MAATNDDLLVPPHSDEAEQAVLGALLLSNEALVDLPELRAEMFYRPQYGAVFSAIGGLVERRQVADVVTVAEAGVAMTMQALNELAMSVPSASNVAGYASIVIDRWQERRLMALGQQLMREAAEPGKLVAAKLDAAMAGVTAIHERKQRAESVGIDKALADFLERLEAEAEGRTEVISTGIDGLDQMMAGGGRRGELMVLGARPKMGKTALVLQLARNMARTRHVLVCSQEMPVYELTSRNVAALGSINLAHMRSPDRMPDDCWGRVSEAVEQARGLNLLLDDQRALTLLDVRRKVMEAKRRGGCDVVIIDFLQLMAGDGDNRNQELDRISNGLKAMAGEFDVWVIVLSQLSREADKRHGPPVMTDLRDSGAIEAAADVIGLLYREFAHPLGEKTPDWKHHAQLELVQRNGTPGTVSLWFSGEFQQFRHWGGPPPSRMSKRVGAGVRGVRGGLGDD